MPRIVLDTDIHPVSDFRTNFSSYINQVHKTKRPIVITQHGRSSAVLLDVTEYELMMDKIDLYQDIKIATKQLNSNKGISHNTAHKRLKKRLQK